MNFYCVHCSILLVVVSSYVCNATVFIYDFIFNNIPDALVTAFCLFYTYSVKLRNYNIPKRPDFQAQADSNVVCSNVKKSINTRS